MRVLLPKQDVSHEKIDKDSFSSDNITAHPSRLESQWVLQQRRSILVIVNTWDPNKNSQLGPTHNGRVDIWIFFIVRFAALSIDLKPFLKMLS